MQSRGCYSVKVLVLALIGLALCITLCLTAAGQAGNAAAALNGTVRDPSGAVVPGATITLVNSRTGFMQVTESNSTGNYSILNIAPGTYTISASKPGFSIEQLSEFDLAVNQTATINFDLKLGTTESTIAVSISEADAGSAATDATGSKPWLRRVA